MACRHLLRRLPARPVQLAGVPAWAPVGYEGPARELVRALKFRGAVALVDAMAAQIAANAPSGLIGARPGPDPARPVLVPVPLHPRRMRARGFNQARLLAEALARRTGLATADCLERLGAEGTQVGRGRRGRRAGPAGRVLMRSGQATEAPAHALLVDDVVTTGGQDFAEFKTHGRQPVAAIVNAGRETALKS